eukprot:m51a1_g14618 putative gram domain-containing protein (430) ;mRNA; f:1218595-1222344
MSHVSHLSTSGAPDSASQGAADPDHRGRAPDGRASQRLWDAAARGDIQALRSCLRDGADPNFMTALHFAAVAKRVHAYVFLAAMGIDQSIKHDGYTAWDLGTEKFRKKVKAMQEHPSASEASSPLDSIDDDRSELLDDDVMETEVDELTEVARAELGCSLKKYFELFFSDGSTFWQMYHDARGDKDVFTGPWQEHPVFGNVREKRFNASVEGVPFSPSSSRFEETQHYTMTDAGLVVQMLSTLLDIPCGDSFRVETEFKVSEIAAGICQMVVCTSCRWLKKTTFQGQIESRTIKQSEQSYALWLKLAREHLASSLEREKVGAGTSAGACEGTPAGSASAAGIPATASSAVHLVAQERRRHKSSKQSRVLEKEREREREGREKGARTDAAHSGWGADRVLLAIVTAVLAMVVYRLYVIEAMLASLQVHHK